MTPMPIDCQSSAKLLPLHVGGDLDPAEAAPLEVHLAACEACRAEAAAAQAARALFFQVAGSDGAEAVDLWPDLSAALARDRAEGAQRAAETTASRPGTHGASRAAPAGTSASVWMEDTRAAADGARGSRSIPASAALGLGGAAGTSRRARRYSLAAAALTLVGSTVFFAALFENAQPGDPLRQQPLAGSLLEGATPVAEGQLVHVGAANSAGSGAADAAPWGLSSPQPEPAVAELQGAAFGTAAFDRPGVAEIAGPNDGRAPAEAGRLRPIRADQRLRIDSIWVPLRRPDGGEGNLANDG